MKAIVGAQSRIESNRRYCVGNDESQPDGGLGTLSRGAELVERDLGNTYNVGGGA
jgi:hypothetical protein